MTSHWIGIIIVNFFQTPTEGKVNSVILLLAFIAACSVRQAYSDEIGDEFAANITGCLGYSEQLVGAC